jgi:hypothetical protein
MVVWSYLDSKHACIFAAIERRMHPRVIREEVVKLIRAHKDRRARADMRVNSRSLARLMPTLAFTHTHACVRIPLLVLGTGGSKASRRTATVTRRSRRRKQPRTHVNT